MSESESSSSSSVYVLFVAWQISFTLNLRIFLFLILLVFISFLTYSRAEHSKLKVDTYAALVVAVGRNSYECTQILSFLITFIRIIRLYNTSYVRYLIRERCP